MTTPAKRIYPTAQEVWENGQHIDDWACDLSDNPNEGIEHEIAYQGKTYYVITDQEDNVLNPREELEPVE